MPKASSAKKSSKPASRPAARPTGKAAQAAAHQGRPAPAQPKTAQPSRGVAVRQPASVPMDPATLANVPAFMRQDADVGKEAISSSDLEIPRLKLMQGLSPELQEFNDLRAGNFFHPAAEFIFNEPFRAVVIHMDRRYLLWRPLDSGGGILARADDGVHWSPGSGEFTVQLDKVQGGDTVTWRLAPTVQESGLANWGTMNPKDPNSPPAATLMYNYLLAFPDEPDLMPAVLSFQRSSIKVGRRFNTKIKTVRTPIFGTIWEFGAVTDTNAQGKEYFNISVKGAGLVEDEDQYHMYKSLYQQYSATGINIRDIEGLQAEEPASNVDEPASASGPNRF